MENYSSLGENRPRALCLQKVMNKVTRRQVVIVIHILRLKLSVCYIILYIAATMKYLSFKRMYLPLW